MRGLGVWIQNGAQGTLPVDANFRTPTASINTAITQTSAITEAAINDVLESIYGETGEIKTFDAICGPKFRKRVSDLQLTCGPKFRKRVSDLQLTAPSDQTATDFVAARQINASASSRKMEKRIDIIVGDFGTINLHTDLFLGYSAGTRTAATGDGRCQELPDLGGGPRFLTDAVCGLLVGNPLKHGAFKPTAN
jgi:hypothetical protein